MTIAPTPAPAASVAHCDERATTKVLSFKVLEGVKPATMLHNWVEHICELAKRIDVVSNERREALSEAGAILPIVSLLHTSIPKATLLLAIEAIAWLALSARCCDEIRKAHGIVALTALLSNSAGPHSYQLEEFVVRALGNLAASSPENRRAIQDVGAIPLLVRALGHGSGSEAANTAAVTLCEMLEADIQAAPLKKATALLLNAPSVLKLCPPRSTTHSANDLPSARALVGGGGTSARSLSSRGNTPRPKSARQASARGESPFQPAEEAKKLPLVEGVAPSSAYWPSAPGSARLGDASSRFSAPNSATTSARFGHSSSRDTAAPVASARATSQTPRARSVPSASGIVWPTSPSGRETYAYRPKSARRVPGEYREGVWPRRQPPPATVVTRAPAAAPADVSALALAEASTNAPSPDLQGDAEASLGPTPNEAPPTQPHSSRVSSARNSSNSSRSSARALAPRTPTGHERVHIVDVALAPQTIVFSGGDGRALMRHWLREHLKRATVVFTQADANHNGKIELRELATLINLVCCEQNVIPPHPDDIQDFFKEFDTNQSGRISMSEFLKMLRGPGPVKVAATASAALALAAASAPAAVRTLAAVPAAPDLQGPDLQEEKQVPQDLEETPQLPEEPQQHPEDSERLPSPSPPESPPQSRTKHVSPFGDSLWPKGNTPRITSSRRPSGEGHACHSNGQRDERSRTPDEPSRTPFMASSKPSAVDELPISCQFAWGLASETGPGHGPQAAQAAQVVSPTVVKPPSVRTATACSGAVADAARDLSFAAASNALSVSEPSGRGIAGMGGLASRYAALAAAMPPAPAAFVLSAAEVAKQQRASAQQAAKERRAAMEEKRQLSRTRQAAHTDDGNDIVPWAKTDPEFSSRIGVGSIRHGIPLVPKTTSSARESVPSTSPPSANASPPRPTSPAEGAHLGLLQALASGRRPLPEHMVWSASRAQAFDIRDDSVIDAARHILASKPKQKDSSASPVRSRSPVEPPPPAPPLSSPSITVPTSTFEHSVERAMQLTSRSRASGPRSARGASASEQSCHSGAERPTHTSPFGPNAVWSRGATPRNYTGRTPRERAVRSHPSQSR
jgi:hypothetical protein